jgi:hypothetical protein
VPTHTSATNASSVVGANPRPILPPPRSYFFGLAGAPPLPLLLVSICDLTRCKGKPVSAIHRSTFATFFWWPSAQGV